jgi:hypothetical protein
MDADAVVIAVEKLVTLRGGRFEGTATELLSALNDIVEETIRKSKYWLATSSQLGSALRERRRCSLLGA